ncbi:hypothetical protein [Hyphomicrobium sp. CS1GBMeth3]|uniref:hypothetical protein n=1 Tax=Hyphomicrobium sp. CS1GBMeth3 TaxID=1892845 RepID=UPI000AF286E4|nr:hypothetical protein [Hyphomicrobium sp. CS1GBMeth3]
MTDKSVTVTDGPDKPALQWALLYPERGQSVMFRTENEIVEARIAEMIEMGNGFDFDLKGTFCSGPLCDQPFHGTYSVESRSGLLTVGL